MSNTMHFTNVRQVIDWLNRRPPEYLRGDAAMLAARASLRALPACAGFAAPDDMIAIFRANAVALAIARVPNNVERLKSAAFLAKAHADNVAAKLKGRACFAGLAAGAAAHSAAMISSSDRLEGALADIADTITLANRAYTAPDPWKFISYDADALENVHGMVVDIPVWLEPVATGNGFSNWINNLNNPVRDDWKRLETQLLQISERWQVWTSWYDGILFARMRASDRAIENSNILNLPDELWRLPSSQTNNRIRMMLRGDAADAASSDDLSILPPPEPLPGPSPATVFEIADGLVDVAETEAWSGVEARALTYKLHAAAICSELKRRLASTNAFQDIKAALPNLEAVLEQQLEYIQPDILRIAALPIESQAVALAHPESEWMLSDAQTVGKIIELSETLVSLQSFVLGDLRRTEAAIRRLKLDEAKATNAKGHLDELNELIAESYNIVTQQTDAVFQTGHLISEAAVGADQRIAVEGDRILQLSNLAAALARTLSEDADAKAQQVGKKAKRKKAAPRAGARADFGQKLRAAAKKGAEKGTEKGVESAVKKAIEGTAEAGKMSIEALAAFAYIKLSVFAGLGLPEVMVVLAWLGYRLQQTQSKKDR